MHDVLVVGASVAGAATAIHLARHGRSVLLIDRASFPRRKACGEGLFSPGVAELDRLGILTDLLPQACVLTSLRFVVGGRSVEAPLGRSGRPVIGVERRLLDDTLLRLATDSGVDVRLGVRATGLIAKGEKFSGIETDHGKLTARVIVAADGMRSRLRRAAGAEVTTRRHRYGVSAHFVMAAPPSPRVEVHFRPGHEVYFTPVGGRLVNVAVLLRREQAARLAGQLRERYCHLVAESGALLSGAQLVDEPLAAGPFPAEAHRAWRGNLVLAGDAAGFYDGVTGEGMSLALVTARLCANAVEQFLMGGGHRPFAAYDRERRDLARHSQLLGMLTLTLAAHPHLGAWVVANLAKRPATFATLLAINQGERGFASLRPRDCLAVLLGV